jgi:hypothetical protein
MVCTVTEMRKKVQSCGGHIKCETVEKKLECVRMKHIGKHIG